MKKAILIMGGIVLSSLALTANAQSDTTKPAPVETTKTDTLDRWDPKRNPTVAEINDRYKDKYVGAKPALTTNDVFPVLGQYESATNPEAANVTITLDPENKGVVWIAGLPQGNVKAMLRKSPAIYKIPAQKTEDGKEVAEGTVAFDKETNTLSMVIGKQFNAADPLAVFAPEPVAEEATTEGEKVIVKKDKEKTKIKTKKDKDAVAKVKPWTYTGTKVEAAVAIK